MKLEQVAYKCGACGADYQAPQLASGSYGEFLLRSSSGYVAYLNAFEDETYDEVDAILGGMESLVPVDGLARARFLQTVYGSIACDPDPEGNVLQIGLKPACPVCGSCAPSAWEYLDPPVFVEIEVPSVEHSLWNSLSPEDKIARVREIALAARS